MAATKLAEYAITMRTGQKLTVKGHLLADPRCFVAKAPTGRAVDRYMLFHAPSGLQIADEDFMLLADAKSYVSRYLDAGIVYPTDATPTCLNCGAITEISEEGTGNCATCPACGYSAFLGRPFYQTYPQEWRDLHFKAPLPKCYTDECSACGKTGFFYNGANEGTTPCGYCKPRPAAEPAPEAHNYKAGDLVDFEGKGTFKVVMALEGYVNIENVVPGGYPGYPMTVLPSRVSPVAPDALIEAGTVDAGGYQGTGRIIGPEFKRADGGVPVRESIDAAEVFAVRYVDGSRQALIRVQGGYQWVWCQVIDGPVYGADGSPLTCTRCLSQIYMRQGYQYDDRGAHHTPDCTHPHTTDFKAPLPVNTTGCLCEMPSLQMSTGRCAHCGREIKAGIFAPPFAPLDQTSKPGEWMGDLSHGKPAYTLGFIQIIASGSGFLIGDIDTGSPLNYRPELDQAVAVAEYYDKHGIASWYAGQGPVILQPPGGPTISRPANPPPAAEPEAVDVPTIGTIVGKLDRLQDQVDALAAAVLALMQQMGVSTAVAAPKPALDYSGIDATIAELDRSRLSFTDQLAKDAAADSAYFAECDQPFYKHPDLEMGEPEVWLIDDVTPPAPDQSAEATDSHQDGKQAAEPVEDTPTELPGLNKARLTCPKCGGPLTSEYGCPSCVDGYTAEVEWLDRLLKSAALKIELKDLYALLDYSPDWVEWAAMQMAARQNSDELAGGFTDEENSIGYSGADASWGSIAYKAIMQYGSLTPKQLAVTRKTLKKYVKSQLLGIANHIPSRPVPPPVAVGDLVALDGFEGGYKVCRLGYGRALLKAPYATQADLWRPYSDLKPYTGSAEAVDDGLEELEF